MNVSALLASIGPDVADAMHPAFVRLLLAEGTIAASDVLGRLWPDELARQLEILGVHLDALWCRAPDELLVVVGRLPPGPRAEQLARLGRVAEAEDALAATSSPVERARALLALTRADGARERMVQAMPVLLGLAIWDLARVAGDHADLWDATQRAQIRRHAAASGHREWAAQVVAALAQVAPVDEAEGDARWVLEHLFDGTTLMSPWRLPALTRVLPFAQMRSVVDPHLRAARGLWDAFSTVPAWAPLAAPDQLDAMVEMIDEGRGYPWDKIRLLALVARHHPPRGAELLGRAREGLPALVTSPGAASGLRPVPYGGRGVATVHQVHVLSGVAAATLGDERRALQQAALARLASDADDYEVLETVCPYDWTSIGEPLDPTLYSACVEVLVGFRDRHTCWGAIAGVVACLPAQAWALGLQGLRRLAG